MIRDMITAEQRLAEVDDLRHNLSQARDYLRRRGIDRGDPKCNHRYVTSYGKEVREVWPGKKHDGVLCSKPADDGRLYPRCARYITARDGEHRRCRAAAAKGKLVCPQHLRGGVLQGKRRAGR